MHYDRAAIHIAIREVFQVHFRHSAVLSQRILYDYCDCMIDIVLRGIH